MDLKKKEKQERFLLGLLVITPPQCAGANLNSVTCCIGLHLDFFGQIMTSALLEKNKYNSQVISFANFACL